jgi:monodehydroascorbate reductase (NADH)
VQSLLAVEQGQAVTDYDYLPSFYSRLLDFGWKFYGVNEGNAVHFGELR